MAADSEVPPRQTKFQALQSFLVRRLAVLRDSQLKRNMRAGSVMAVIGSGISIISYPLYLRYLGYHRLGLWLVLCVVISVAQLGNLGIPWALMKLVAEEHSRGDWEGVRAYINVGCGLIAALGSVFVIAIVIARPIILNWSKLSGPDARSVNSLLIYVAVLSSFVMLFETFNAALGGLGRIDLSSYNETIAQSLVVVFSASLLFMGLDLWAMVFGSLAGYGVAQTVSFVQVQRRMPFRLIAWTTISRHKARRLLNTGGWIVSGSAIEWNFTRRFNAYEYGE